METSRKWKIAGVASALIPAAILLVFAVGEGASGIGHYGQLVPVVLLAICGWYTPRAAGFVLIFGAIALMLMYAMSAGAPLATTALVELILFAPLLLSGAFFLYSSKGE